MFFLDLHRYVYKLRTCLIATKILFIACHISSHSSYLTSKTQGVLEVFLKNAEIASPPQYSPLPHTLRLIHPSIHFHLDIHPFKNAYLSSVGERNKANVSLAFNGTYRLKWEQDVDKQCQAQCKHHRYSDLNNYNTIWGKSRLP